MRTALICQAGATMSREGIARWLASFSELSGIVALREPRGTFFKRIRYETRRIGFWRLFDVLAFRMYYKLRHAHKDRRWQQQTLDELRQTYPHLPDGLPVLVIDNINDPAAERFLRDLAPDIVIARCKQILKERVFSIPTHGTFVIHPGICPEYRNAHGCFWALANDDLDKVGATLLRIDAGVDTGPVLGYYSYPYDELRDSHVVIQSRVVLDNLEQLRNRLLEVYNGTVEPLDVSGRTSSVWGQPWLTAYLRWKRRARRRRRGL